MSTEEDLLKKEKKKNVKTLLEEGNETGLNLSTLDQDKKKAVVPSELAGYKGSAAEVGGVPEGEGDFPDYRTKKDWRPPGAIDERMLKRHSSELLPDPERTRDLVGDIIGVKDDDTDEQVMMKLHDYNSKFFLPLIDDDEATAIYKNQQIQNIIMGFSERVGDAGVEGINRLSADHLTKIPTPYDFHQLFESKEALNEIANYMLNNNIERQKETELDYGTEHFIEDFTKKVESINFLESNLYADAIQPILDNIVTSNMKQRTETLEGYPDVREYDSESIDEIDRKVSPADLHSAATYKEDTEKILEIWDKFEADNSQKWGRDEHGRMSVGSIVDQIWKKGITNNALGKYVMNIGIEGRRVPVSTKLAIVDAHLMSNANKFTFDYQVEQYMELEGAGATGESTANWRLEGLSEDEKFRRAAYSYVQKSNLPRDVVAELSKKIGDPNSTKAQINAMYDELSGGTAIVNQIPVDAKLAMYDGWNMGTEMAGAFIQNLEGLVSGEMITIGLMLNKGGPVVNTLAGGMFFKHSVEHAVQSFQSSQEYRRAGHPILANYHLGNGFAGVAFMGLTGRHTYKGYTSIGEYKGLYKPLWEGKGVKKPKGETHYSDPIPSWMYDLVPEGVSGSKLKGWERTKFNIYQTYTAMINELGGPLYVAELAKRGVSNIPGFNMVEHVRDNKGNIKVEGVETISDTKKVPVEKKLEVTGESGGKLDWLTTEWIDGHPVLRVDTKKLQKIKGSDLYFMKEEINLSNAVINMYNHNLEKVSGTGAFEVFDYKKTHKNKYPEIDANGNITYELKIRTGNDGKWDTHDVTVDNILKIDTKSVGPEYVDFYLNSAFFNAKTGEHKVWYHATPVVDLKELKGGQSIKAWEVYDHNGKLVPQGDILWLASDGASSINFVSESKIQNKGGKIFNKGVKPKDGGKTKSTTIDMHPVHVNITTDAIFDCRNSSHVKMLTEPHTRAGFKHEGVRLWEEYVDKEYNSGGKERLQEKVKEAVENAEEYVKEEGQGQIVIEVDLGGKATKSYMMDWYEGMDLKQDFAYILKMEAFGRGDWTVLEKFQTVLKQQDYKGFYTYESGYFDGANLAMFTEYLGKETSVKSINNRNPSGTTKSLMEPPKSVKEIVNKEADVVYQHAFAGAEGTAARVGVEMLKELYKDIKNGDLKREKITGIAMYEEYLNFETQKPSKKGFENYVLEILKPDESSKAQTEIVRNIIDSYETIKTDHAYALEQLKKLPEGEGGMPKPTVVKKGDGATENYISNFNLDKVSESQRPFFEEVFRHVGEEAATQIRGKRDWSETKAEATKPEYLQEIVNDIFNTENVITKDGKPNPKLEVNDIKIHAYDVLTSGFMEMYKNNPTPENLSALIKVVNANAAVTAVSGRALQSNKMKVQASHSAVILDRLMNEIGENQGTPGFVSKIVEYGRNMKLMSMSSIVGSSVGNTAHMLLTLTDMPISAINNYILNSMDKTLRDAIYKDMGWGEPKVESVLTRRQTDIIAFAEGFYNYMPEAARKAWALMKEDPEAVAKHSLYSREAFKFNTAIGKGWEPLYEAIGIEFGTMVRTPQRAQGAIDIIIREPAIAGFIHRAVSNVAQNEGLKHGSKEYNSRVKELLENPSEKIVKEALESGEYVTFQSELGPVGRQVNMLRSGKMEVGQLWVPFFNTVVNIGKTGIHRSPLGVFTPNYVKGINQGMKTGDWGPFADANAKIMTGTAIMYLMNETLNPVNNIEIEGSWRNLSEDERTFKQAQGYQQNSIRFYQDDGSHWSWNYDGYEPIATFLRATAGYQRGKTMQELINSDPDYENYLKDDKLSFYQKIQTNPLANAGEALVMDFIDNPFMKGVSELETLASNLVEGNRGANVTTYTTDMARGILMPNIISQSRKVIDPIYREKPGSLYEAFVHNVPGLTHKNLPKLGLFGEAISHPNKEIGSMFRFKTTSNINKNYDAMYNELDKIGLSELPVIGNQGWSKGFTNEQVFFAKHVMGDHLAEMLSTLMLDENGEISADWKSIEQYPELKQQIVLQHYNNAKLMAKSQFIENWVFDAEREVKEMVATFESHNVSLPDDSMVNQITRFVHENHNKALMRDPEWKERIETLKKKKEDEYHDREKAKESN